MTDIQLESMSDVDMYQFIEKGMRGGISYIANRHGEANNKYMKTHDENKASKYITYLDANKLYWWAMSQYLPTGKFKWIQQRDIEQIDLAKYKNNSKKVDQEYPKELHDLHNDYPLAAVKIKATEDMLSKYAKEIKGKFNISIGQVSKLIPRLSKKEKYVLHYRNLQLYLDLGLKLKKEHKQKILLKKISLKLMNNAVFGKTM